MPARRSRGRTALLGLLMVLVTIGLAAAAAEGLLRVVYRDGGRRTLGGPGGHPFEYTYFDREHELRGPMATGPKAPGVTRLMVLGDSITWGQGVGEWTDTYPAKLLATLNREQVRYDLAVYARPGKEIDNHLSTTAAAIDQVDPDVVVYQWYSNDVELSKAARPVSQRGWRTWPGHDTLRAWSYLYFGLDFVLDVYLPSPGRTYLQYMEQEYAAGTPGWQAFARAFHEWAAYATAYADRTILMLYPVVPSTALVDLRQRMTALAHGQVLAVGPDQMAHAVGSLVTRDGAQALASPAGTMAGELARTPGVRLAHGDYVATVQLRLDAPAPGAVARVTMTDGAEARELAAVDVAAGALTLGAWQPVSIPFAIGGRMSSDVALHVAFSGSGALSVGRAELPVVYGMEVLDLAPRFGTMRTGASLFDAHPNAAAHAVMAEALAALIQAPPAR